MKKHILLVILIALKFAPAKAQYVTIPDANFSSWLMMHYPTCMSGVDMDTTCPYIVNETSLDAWSFSIVSLSGVEFFKNLISINCSGNYLTSLPALPASLRILDCNSNYLTSLPVLPDSLRQFDCSNNELTSLPVLPNLLDTLRCSDNHLTNLPSLPNTIEWLQCDYNQLTGLPTLPGALKRLTCGNNQLSSFPLLPSTLQFLECHNNALTSLPLLPNTLLKLFSQHNPLTSFPAVLPDSLKDLNCADDNLTSLPALPNALQFLNCESNQLTSLPALPGSLIKLYCGYNQLTSLPALPGILQQLGCNNMQLTSLPNIPNTLLELHCNSNQLTSIPPLPGVMDLFDISSNSISCVNNLPQVANGGPWFGVIYLNALTCVPNQTWYSMGLPLCTDNDPVNNPNNCPGVNITGHVYTDWNSNCNYDNTDLMTENIPVKLFDNQNNLVAQSYAINGVYSFASLLPDTFQVKVDDNTLPVSMACGQSNYQGVMLDSANQTVTGIDFPVVCDTTYDINVQSVNAQGLVFPGQIHWLKTNITNNQTWYNMTCGSSNNSGPVVIQITGPVTYFSPGPSALTPVVNGNTFTYNITDFNSLTPSSFGLRLMTDTSAQVGDQVCVHVTISPTPLDDDTTNNVYDFCYNVLNSYDPNMKEVYPVDVIPGYDDWFTYTIHFQNTGNAPAFNIRLRDTLDAQLDLNTFEVLGYSHAATTALSGNILNVRFNNIMLPDSTTDHDGSMGYFQYRIKPLANLPLGTHISNTAYIYFDYNAPVVTNTTQNNFTTVVSTNNALPPASRLWLYPNPSTGIFTFNDSKNIKTVEVFNMIGEQIITQTNHDQIDLSKYSQGIYFAKINSNTILKLVKE